MLILTPTPLQTAAERAFFAELSAWDTGTGVRGAVMASLPVVEGPMERRQADAVLFVPEGLAVVRVVEVERRSGVVTAVPDGAWTIGSGDGPGDVVQLDGGGSTPLEGLMRAGMQAAVTLRAAGLEPGRIARLTVLTGSVTGVLPADGDLGEGDQVAHLDRQSLLLGVARAARHAGTDNPRIWTTADVRAGIEALGVAGRTPSVEELNGEGFPYSPYVLRRQELLAPAAINAAPPRFAQPTWTAEPAAPPAPQQRPPLVDPAAAARVAAAAVQAQEDAERAVPAPADRREETQHVRTSTPPASVGRAQETQALVPDRAPADDHAPADRSADDHRAPDDSGGLGGLFGANRTVEVAPQPRRELPAELRPRAAVGEVPPTRSTSTVAPAGGSGDEGRGPGRRRLLLAVAALVVLAALVTVVVLLLDRDDDPDRPVAGAPTGTSAGPATTGPVPGATQVIDGTTFTLEAAVDDDSCADHAYGSVEAFFGRSDCTALTRQLWSAEVDGRPAVVSAARVTMPDTSLADALKALADTDGSGNVDDLLRDGVRYTAGPAKLTDAQYDSSVVGSVVTIVETSYVDEQGSAEALDALAATALTLGQGGGQD